MILLGGTIAILSLIGLMVFAITGLYLIHPIFYIELWILGNGLAITGSVNAWENFNKEDN